MKKIVLATLITLTVLTAGATTVKADTVDDLRNNITKIEKQIEKNDKKLEKAKEGSKAEKEAYKKDAQLEKKLEKAESKYYSYMHTYALTNSNKKAFSFVANNVEVFNKKELKTIAYNYSQWVAKKLGVEVKFWVNDTLKGTQTNGFYRNSEKCVHINPDTLKSEKFFNTIAHEVRHAWQHTQAQYDDDFMYYISSSDDIDGYLEQEVEVDARQYGEKMLNSLLNMNY